MLGPGKLHLLSLSELHRLSLSELHRLSLGELHRLSLGELHRLSLGKLLVVASLGSLCLSVDVALLLLVLEQSKLLLLGQLLLVGIDLRQLIVHKLLIRLRLHLILLLLLHVSLSHQLRLRLHGVDIIGLRKLWCANRHGLSGRRCRLLRLLSVKESANSRDVLTLTGLYVA